MLYEATSPLLLLGDCEKVVWSDSQIQELWSCTLDLTPPTERASNIEVDACVLMRLVRDLLAEAGANESDGVTHMANWEFAASGLYARKPKLVFETAVKALDQKLRDSSPSANATRVPRKSAAKGARRSSKKRSRAVKG